MISHTETTSIFKTGGRNYDPLESAYNDYRDVFEFFFTAGQASVLRRPYLNEGRYNHSSTVQGNTLFVFCGVNNLLSGTLTSVECIKLNQLYISGEWNLFDISITAQFTRVAPIDDEKLLLVSSSFTSDTKVHIFDSQCQSTEEVTDVKNKDLLSN